MKKGELKVKQVKGQIKTLSALPYKGYMIYIRRIEALNIFEWLFSFNNQIYSSYLILAPGKGKTSLAVNEVNAATVIVLAGARATIDTLLGQIVSGKDKMKAEMFIKATEGNKPDNLVN